MRTTQVHKDSNEVIVTYPPFEPAYLFQPTEADVRIRTNAVPMPDEGSEVACSIDTVDTSLQGPAAPGDSSLTVASGSGIVRQRFYLIEDGANRYPVHVAEVSGTTVYLSEPLADRIPNNTPLKGLAIITPSLTADQTATAGRSNLAKFRATLDGVQREFDQWFEIVRQVFPITLSPTRLLRRGEVRNLRRSTDVGLMDTIQAAWEDTLRPKLRASGILEETINTPTEIEPAHIEAVMLHLYRDSGADEEKIADQESRLERCIADVKASSKMRIDVGEVDGSPSEEPDKYADYMIPRLTR